MKEAGYGGRGQHMGTLVLTQAKLHSPIAVILPAESVYCRQSPILCLLTAVKSTSLSDTYISISR